MFSFKKFHNTKNNSVTGMKLILKFFLNTYQLFYFHFLKYFVTISIYLKLSVWCSSNVICTFLDVLITGLLENDLHEYSHLLTGYIRCPMFLKKVAEVYKMLKKKNPDLIFGKYIYFTYRY